MTNDKNLFHRDSELQSLSLSLMYQLSVVFSFQIDTTRIVAYCHIICTLPLDIYVCYFTYSTRHAFVSGQWRRVHDASARTHVENLCTESQSKNVCACMRPNFVPVRAERFPSSPFPPFLVSIESTLCTL